LNKNRPAKTQLKRFRLILPEAKAGTDAASKSESVATKRGSSTKASEPVRKEKEKVKEPTGAATGSTAGSAKKTGEEKELSKVEEYKRRLVELYRKHNPTKVDTVDNLLRRSKGDEHGLYSRVSRKYGSEPAEEYKGSTEERVLFDLDLDIEAVVNSTDIPGQGKYEVLFEKIAVLPRKHQQAGINKLALLMGQNKASVKELLSTMDPSLRELVTNFRTIRETGDASYEQVMSQLEPTKRVMLEVIAKLLDEVASAVGSKLTADPDKEKNDVKEGKKMLEKLLGGRDRGGKKEFDMKDVMSLFTNLGKLPESKQRAGIDQVVAAFRTMPELRKAFDGMGAENLKQFKQMEMLQKVDPVQYHQLTSMLPPENKIMMEVFTRIYASVEDKKEDKKEGDKGPAKGQHRNNEVPEGSHTEL